MDKTWAFERAETRIPMTIAVRLGSEEMRLAETTFTRNVSARGTQVMTSRFWRTDARVRLASMPGDFSARGRVAYCEELPSDTKTFVIGVEFLEPSGKWVVGHAAGAAEKILNG